ncbi:alpha/beta fold hydrolase [Alkalicoccus chagannorensis]|uniref:alpha/beta fold hydrolase n=1 Tax=Alkalicoccus chagannorensis TaxID=427072 RepID=UPI0004241868|nr:alpha/beta hydrolase [Alkalicoccus chagannorensis]
MRYERKTHYVQTAPEVTLHVVTAGPHDAPAALLLHGFPEFWYGWDKQIDAVVEAGYRAIVPDQRGYNLSSKPAGRRSYALDILCRDMTALLDAFHVEKAVVMGHDWGGAVAWQLAADHPERVEKLLAVNIPYPGAMPEIMARQPLQLLQSSYMLFFQLPGLPEKIFAAEDYEQMKQGIASSAMPGAFTEDELELYKEAWKQPGAMTSMLHWYRALWFGSVRPKRIEPPVRILWGLGDPFLHRDGAKRSLRWCQEGELIFIGEATHWVLHEQPAIVNEKIREFLQDDTAR